MLRRRWCLVLLATLLPSGAGARVKQAQAGAFVVEHEVVLPASPESVFDAITGDVQGWWDHSFSKAPRRIYIEPRLGGSFIEIFDEAGNGAVHGTVIYFDRGRKLRLVGPLGFSGHAIQMVHTFDLSSAENGQTRLRLVVSASGVTDPAWPQAVDKVWQHFLEDRLRPFVGPAQAASQPLRSERKPAARPAAPAVKPKGR